MQKITSSRFSDLGYLIKHTYQALYCDAAIGARFGFVKKQVRVGQLMEAQNAEFFYDKHVTWVWRKDCRTATRTHPPHREIDNHAPETWGGMEAHSPKVDVR